MSWWPGSVATSSWWSCPPVADWHEPVALARRLVRAVAEPVEVEGHWIRVGASAGVALSGTAAGAGSGPARPAAVRRHGGVHREAAHRRPGRGLRRRDGPAGRRPGGHRGGAGRGAARPGPSCRWCTSRCWTRSRVTRWVSRRWCAGTGPTLRPVSPAVFVPIAERSGLVVDLDLWVLETALGAAGAPGRRTPAMAPTAARGQRVGPQPAGSRRSSSSSPRSLAALRCRPARS